MALVFDENNGGPQTHALIVGVGGYDHLVGGRDQKNQIIPQIGVLRQLTSPPRSASAFAEYLIEWKDTWIRPLGTVELLLSTAPDDADFSLPDGFTSSAATFESLQAAYDRWRARLDQNEDNVSVFYHCGHGVEKEEQYLLTEDFGRFPNNPWLGAFAFDSTQMAMRVCKATTQCFFIDACREITDPMKDHNITVMPLETVDHDEPEKDVSFTVKATAAKETALGPQKGVAYGTQALIRALKGDAAENGSRGWAVRTAIIADKITKIMKLIKDDADFNKRCHCILTDSQEIVRLPAAPRVTLQIGCAPDAATEVADFTCQSLVDPGAAPIMQQGGPLDVEVDAGIYSIGAHFPQGEFRNAERAIQAAPLKKQPPLDCSP